MKFADDQQKEDFHQAATRLEFLGRTMQAEGDIGKMALYIADARNALQVLTSIHQYIVQTTCDHGGLTPNPEAPSAAMCRKCGIPVKMPER